jgi:hypothetical protein
VHANQPIVAINEKVIQILLVNWHTNEKGAKFSLFFKMIQENVFCL